MDRVIVQDSALVQTTDVLNTNIFGMLGQSALNAVLFGSNGLVCQGFACTPTVPASLNVTVGPGSIYSQDEVDATAYGDLGTNTTVVIKQGILSAPVTLTITPPTTSGFSQVYLVEVELQDIDAGAEVVSFFDSDNPEVPFAGPNNDGESQFTERTCVATIALKAGAAAATGSQQTPTPDVGFTGLYAITVTNGQTTVTSANIVQLVTAPLRNDDGGPAFFPTLQSIPADVQDQTWVGFTDQGTAANSYQITPYPPITALQLYQKFCVKIGHTNTGPSNLTVVTPTGSLTAAIQLPSGNPLSGDELHTGSLAEFGFDGSVFELLSFPANGGASGGGGGATPAPVFEVGVSGLSGSAPGATKTATWTIQQIIAAASLGSATVVFGANQSLTFTGTTTGAGGMDTGSMPVSADLSVYAIFNPTSGLWNTLGCAGSTSNGPTYTGTNMPTGFTVSVLIWAGVPDSSGDFIRFAQRDRTVWVVSVNVLTNGTAEGSTQISVANVVPVAAKSCAGNWSLGPSTGGAALSGTSISGAFPGDTDIGFQWIGANGTTTGILANFDSIPMVTPQTLFYETSTGVNLSVGVDQYAI
jgi:hypothetical protein